jgi:hypothetical protein
MSKWNHRATSFALLGVVVALLFVAMTSRPDARVETSTEDYVTFRAPVALPGVTLGAGEYSFRVNYVDSGNAVQVRHRESNRLMFLGLTERVLRPASVDAGTFRLGEAREGEAAPVLVWYPTSTMLGFRFLHAGAKR